MTSRTRLLNVALLAVALAAARPHVPAAQPVAPVVYTVTVPEPEHHWLQVEAVFPALDAGPRPHVAADIGPAGEEAAEVGVVLLPLDLVRAELVHRAGAVERLGRELTERLIVVAHRRRSSLSPVGSRSSCSIGPSG